MKTVTCNQQRSWRKQNLSATASFFGAAALIIRRYFYQDKAKVQEKHESNSSKRCFWCYASCSLATFQIAQQNKTGNNKSQYFQHPSATFLNCRRQSVINRPPREVKHRRHRRRIYLLCLSKLGQYIGYTHGAHIFCLSCDLATVPCKITKPFIFQACPLWSI